VNRGAFEISISPWSWASGSTCPRPKIDRPQSQDVSCLQKARVQWGATRRLLSSCQRARRDQPRPPCITRHSTAAESEPFCSVEPAKVGHLGPGLQDLDLINQRNNFIRQPKHFVFLILVWALLVNLVHHPPPPPDSSLRTSRKEHANPLHWLWCWRWCCLSCSGQLCRPTGRPLCQGLWAPESWVMSAIGLGRWKQGRKTMWDQWNFVFDIDCNTYVCL